MDATFLIVLLAMFTMLAAAVFAIVSKERTEELRRDPKSPKSSLSRSSPGPSAV